jgi:large subunit ribosomal protein L13
MVKVIDGKDTALGRLASYAAKEALKGEDIIIINCKDVIITGNKKNIKKEFKEKRNRVGSGQKGPKISRLDYQIIKRAIRGMLPNYRTGKGRIALKRIKCYDYKPEGYKKEEEISIKKDNLNGIKIGEIKK